MLKIIQVFEEDNGNLSTIRFLTVLIIVTILFNWTWHNIHSQQFVSFNWNDVMAIIGTLIAKGWQKGKEQQGG